MIRQLARPCKGLVAGLRLLNVVARNPPLAISVQRRSHRLHRRLLMLEAAVVLQHDILAIGRPRQGGLVVSASELTRHQFAQRLSAYLERALPLLLAHRDLERPRGLLPASSVVFR